MQKTSYIITSQSLFDFTADLIETENLIVRGEFDVQYTRCGDPKLVLGDVNVENPLTGASLPATKAIINFEALRQDLEYALFTSMSQADLHERYVASEPHDEY